MIRHVFRPITCPRPLLRLGCALAALTWFAGAGSHGVRAAWIPTDSVHVTLQRAGSRFSITATGQTEASPALLLVYIHLGSQFGANSCASDPHVEAALVMKEMRVSAHEAAVLVYQPLNAGKYSVRTTWGAGAPAGSYWICGYLLAASQQPVNVLARNSARITVGSRLSPRPLYSLYGFRLQPTNQADWGLREPALLAVHSGQIVYLSWYLRANQDVRSAAITLKDAWVCTSGLTSTMSHSWVVNDRVGKRRAFFEERSLTLAADTNSDACIVKGDVTIGGLTQTRSITVIVNR